MLRPEIIVLSLMLKVSGIEREAVDRGCNAPFLYPFSLQWIGGATLQCEHPMLEQAVGNLRAMGRRKVDIPLTVDNVQLRCPDQVAHRPRRGFTPDDLRWGLCKLRQFPGAAQFQAIVLRHRGDKIVIAVAMAIDKGIGTLFNQWVRVNRHLFLSRVFGFELLFAVFRQFLIIDAALFQIALDL
ncbi:hypothetical protein D3C80_1292020 [compost metagenome]